MVAATLVILDARHTLKRANRAVLVLDVVESVRLIERDEEGTIGRWLHLTEEVDREILPRFDGTIVKRLGDGMLIAFDSGRDAVAAGFAIQEVSTQLDRSVPTERKILLRTGIETGEFIIDRHDIYGRGVNIAARLAALAGPGEMVISANVREQITPEVDADVEDLGECYLKHVRQTVRAYRIRPPGAVPALEPGIPIAELLPTLAIVPFTPRDVAPEHAVLGDILAEESIFALSRSPELNVISRLSTSAFRNREISLFEIGVHLNATYVLSGAYRVVGRHLLLDVELAEASSGQIVWSKRHKTPVAALLTGRRELVHHLVHDISSAIMLSELKHARSQALPTLKSYTLLMAAIALMHRLSKRDFEEARRLLETLVDRASRQAIPCAWLAKWHVLRVQQGWSTEPQADAQLALQCTKQALDTDPSCSLALAIDGFVHTNLLKRLDIAADRYRVALECNPNDSLAWLLKGTMHAFKDEGAQAVTCTQRALKLSPLDPHRYFFDSLAATAYLSAHQYDRALKAAQRSFRANRTHTSTLRAMTVAQWKLGDIEGAHKSARELMTLEPDFTIESWRARSPSAFFNIGREWAEVFRDIGLPNV